MINQLFQIGIFEGYMSIFSSIVFLAGVIIALVAYHKKRTVTTVLLIILMISGFFYTFSNIFEKFNVWSWADEFGDSFIVAFATIFIVLGSVVVLQEKLLTSNSRYQKAFKEANFYKDLFSHDMSNVIQNIKSSSDLIFTNFSSFDKSKITEFLEIIRGQSIRGANLISNIRKLSKIEDSEKNLVPVNVFTILTETIDYINKTFHNQTLKIEIDVWDKNYILNANEFLTDVFENILINAINYNENPVKEILVKIYEESNAEDEKHLIMKFIDNGIGISDARKKIIFLKGFEIEKRTKGMGLGLTLVKEIVESYNGEIKVENNVKEDYTKGSKFILKFPLCKETLTSM